jgi:periplasmic divalent cation tolerance protein
MTDCCLVLCTVPSLEVAETIAQGLLAKHLAACVGVLPAIQSHYVWKGEFCREEEILLLVKTTVEAYPWLEPSLRAMHPYEVPEIIRLPIEAGWPPYLEWVRNSVLSGREDAGSE